MRYSLDPSEEVRLISYRAAHLANQRRSQRAMQMAQDATTRRRELAGEMTANRAASGERMFDAAAFVTAAGDQGRSAEGDDARPGRDGAGRHRPEPLPGGGDAGPPGPARRGRGGAERRSWPSSMLEPRVPRRWRPQCQWLLANIDERRGDLRSARSAAGRQHRRLSAPWRPTRATKLWRCWRWAGCRRRCRSRMRRCSPSPPPSPSSARASKASASKMRCRSTRPRWPRRRASRRREAQIYTEMFDIGQLTRTTHAAQSIALASARLASSDREVGRLIRELQDARRQRDAVRETLAVAEADPAALAPADRRPSGPLPGRRRGRSKTRTRGAGGGAALPARPRQRGAGQSGAGGAAAGRSAGADHGRAKVVAGLRRRRRRHRSLSHRSRRARTCGAWWACCGRRSTRCWGRPTTSTRPTSSTASCSARSRRAWPRRGTSSSFRPDRCRPCRSGVLISEPPQAALAGNYGQYAWLARQ